MPSTTVRTAAAAEPDRLAIFTWGYWGWGTAPHQFVQAADAVEASRGFAPPFFVDIRIRRSVRAPGFSGATFERTVGAGRHQWMKALGNRAVLDGRPGILIDQPKAAGDLLDIAVERARSRQRVVFFCACEFPGHEHAGGCHRAAVATLVLDAARRRGLPVQVEEWPGGLPLEGVDLNALAARPIDLHRKSIVVNTSAPLAVVAGLPWGSLGEVRLNTREPVVRCVLTGPARFSSSDGVWLLPMLGCSQSGCDASAASDPQAARAMAVKLRAERGLEPRLA
jgi:hypothetical protein